MEKDTSQAEQKPIDPGVNISRQAKRSGFNPFSLFWGFLFIELGVLIILHNFELIELDLANVWRLWPLAIVAVGFSLFSIKGRWGTVITSVLLLGILISISLVATGALGLVASPDSHQSQAKIALSAASVEQANVSIRTGAGKLTIDSADIKNIVEARLDSTFATLRQTTSTKNNIQSVALSTDGGSRWWSGEHRNNLAVTMNQSVPLQVTVNAGASQTIADFSQVSLRQFNLDSGASDISITLGQKLATTSVNIDVGMSSITFRVPKDSGISLEVDHGMSSTDTADLRDVGNGRYESEGFADAAHKITIQGDMGMANLDIEYY